MSSIYFSLLKQWSDGMLAHQLKDLDNPHFDGALICPACRYLHGRSHDAVYPLLYMCERTGDLKYLEAAKKLFDWHAYNMVCDDGSAYNDSNSAWNGITVFAAVALCEALAHHGGLLDAQTKARWEDKLQRMAAWLYEGIHEASTTNINYLATNAAALALCGRYLNKPAYLQRADALASHVMGYFTENGLLFGEGKPHGVITPRGCRAIDIGYNVEESVPALIKYALVKQDESLLGELSQILTKQLRLMLPDGAWDNSFGSRNNKWTYFGSRTSDGCQGGYALLADRNPLFAEASLRNTELMERCTHNGLLHGGLHYVENNEPACIHHTFTHANALAAALDAGIERYTQRCALPSDTDQEALFYYPELDTYKLAAGDWRATVTGYDYNIEAGHATGGTLSLLWHKKLGPVIASSVVDYRLVEPHNMQLPLEKARHQSLTPRVERMVGEQRYSQCYDKKAVIEVRKTQTEITAWVHASLVTLEQTPLQSPVGCSLCYHITPQEVLIQGHIYGAEAEKAVFVLPIIAKDANVSVTPACAPATRIFFLTGGHGADAYQVSPDAEGRFEVRIKA